MTDNYLPIKIIEKRMEIDERETEGGGSNLPPRWVLENHDLELRSGELLSDLNMAKDIIKTKLKKQDKVPAVLTASFIEEASAKTHRAEIVQFFKIHNQERVIGLSDNRELFVRIDSIHELDIIGNKLIKPARNAKTISAINEMKAFEPTINISEMTPSNTGKYIVKVTMIDYGKPDINKYLIRTFKDQLSKLQSVSFVKSSRYTDTLYVHKIVADSQEAIKNVATINGIYSIEPMPFLETTKDEVSSDTTINIKTPRDDINYPIVGVLDTGIADIAQLQPWVVGRHTSYPDAYSDRIVHLFRQ